MSNEHVLISQPASSNTVRLYWSLTVKAADGKHLAGEEATVTLAGSGSLAPGFDSKEIKRLTDENGEAHVTWYRRNIWGRAVNATMTIEAPNAASIAIEELPEAPPEMQGPNTGWTPRRPIKI